MTPLSADLRRWRSAGLLDEAAVSRIRAFEEHATGLEARLERWQAAGLLDEAGAAAITEFEAARPRRERPGLVEALVYLGVAVVAVGVAVLVGVSWGGMPYAGRVASAAVPALAFAGAGQVLRLARQAGLRRGGAMAWLASLALIVATAAIAGYEGGWWSDESLNAPLGLAGLALAAAVVFWLFSRAHPQLIGLMVSAFALAFTLGVRVDDDGPVAVFGFALLTAGVCAGLAHAAILTPRPAARVLSTVAAFVAAQAFAFAVAAESHVEDGTLLQEGPFVYGLIIGGLASAGVAVSRARVLAPSAAANLLAEAFLVPAAVTIAVGVADQVGEDHAALAWGLTFGALCALALAATEAGALRPRAAARPVAAGGLVLAAIFAGFAPGPVAGEFVAPAVAVALLAVSLGRGSLTYMGFFVAAFFVSIITPIARHVEDPQVAAMALIAVGVLLLATVALFVREAPRWRRRHTHGSAGAAA